MNPKSPVPAILCVDDEAPVLDALMRDLAEFESKFRLEGAANVSEARDIVADLVNDRIPLALVLCDHLMPGVNGTDFLIELDQAKDTHLTRKILVTAHAGLMDTVRAVNEAGLHHYIAKPWSPTSLQMVVKQQLTEFILAAGIPPMPFLALLDAARLSAAIISDNVMTDR